MSDVRGHRQWAKKLARERRKLETCRVCGASPVRTSDRVIHVRDGRVVASPAGCTP